MFVLAMLLLGLAGGSFVNAAVYRIHKQAEDSKQKTASKKTRPNYSLWRGRSICPHCRHQLAWYDLIPVLSWLWLRGRCRYCGKPISVQYPIVELVTAGLFVLSFVEWNFGRTFDYFQFGVWLVLLTGLMVLAVYDLKWMILPNRVIKPLMVIALIQLAAILVFGQSKRIAFEHLLAASLAGSFFYALFAVSKGRWMGGGDVKLAFLMGLILVARDSLVAFVLAFNVAAIISVGLIISKQLSRKSLIPFGPFLIGATIVGQLYGQEIFQAYLDLVTVY